MRALGRAPASPQSPPRPPQRNVSGHHYVIEDQRDTCEERPVGAQPQPEVSPVTECLPSGSACVTPPLQRTSILAPLQSLNACEVDSVSAMSAAQSPQALATPPPYSALRRGVEWKGLAANLTEVYGLRRASTSFTGMFDVAVCNAVGHSLG